MKRILNLGCGTTPLKSSKDIEYTNMDILALQDSAKVDVNYLEWDILKVPYPVEHKFDSIYIFHVIEHIPEFQHIILLSEFRRILKPDGQIVFTYPEFLRCADNYKTNKDGRRDYWKMTIYGRGYTEWDRHKALMDTPIFVKFLNENGFEVTKVSSEKSEPENTVLVCKLGAERLSYEELMGKEFS